MTSANPITIIPAARAKRKRPTIKLDRDGRLYQYSSVMPHAQAALFARALAANPHVTVELHQCPRSGSTDTRDRWYVQYRRTDRDGQAALSAEFQRQRAESALRDFNDWDIHPDPIAPGFYLIVTRSRVQHRTSVTDCTCDDFERNGRMAGLPCRHITVVRWMHAFSEEVPVNA